MEIKMKKFKLKVKVNKKFKGKPLIFIKCSFFAKKDKNG